MDNLAIGVNIMAYNLLLAKRIKMTSYKWYWRRRKPNLYVKKVWFERKSTAMRNFFKTILFSIALFKPYQTIIIIFIYHILVLPLLYRQKGFLICKPLWIESFTCSVNYIKLQLAARYNHQINSVLCFSLHTHLENSPVFLSNVHSWIACSQL